jgi:hypothetical protein
VATREAWLRREAPDTEGKLICWARFYDLGTTLLSFGQLAALHRRIVALAGIRPGERAVALAHATQGGASPGRTHARTGSEMHSVESLLMGAW